MLKNKIWPNFQRIIKLFTKKFVTKLSKIWVLDPGSKIRDPEKSISDPGSRCQKGTGSRIRIRNTKKAFSVAAVKVQRSYSQRCGSGTGTVGTVTF